MSKNEAKEGNKQQEVSKELTKKEGHLSKEMKDKKDKRKDKQKDGEKENQKQAESNNNSRKTQNEASAMDNKAFLQKFGYFDFNVIVSGGQGTVYSARSNKPGHKRVAVKVVKVEKPSKMDVGEDLQREMSIQAKLNHLNIIKIIELLRSKTKVYIIMEFAPNGTVGTVVIKKGGLNEYNAKCWFCPIAKALQYLHDSKIAHRDLKLQNILLDRHFNPKLSDFGLSRFVEYNGDQLMKCKTYCGTPAYYPPEIITRTPYDPYKADVFSFGICLFEMLNKDMPFDEHNKKRMLKQEISRDIQWRKDIKSNLTEDVIDLMIKMMEPEPELRPTMAEVCKHSWFPLKQFDSFNY